MHYFISLIYIYIYIYTYVAKLEQIFKLFENLKYLEKWNSYYLFCTNYFIFCLHYFINKYFFLIIFNKNF